MVGDYLFTDPDFVNHLSTSNRNLFQKIYDEIKYLWKTATAGSKEARQLEKVKKAFEDAYRADSKSEAKKNTAEDSGTKFSISKTSKMPYNEQLVAIENGNLNGSNSLYIGEPSKQLQDIGFSNAPFAMNQSDYRKSRRDTAKNKNYSSHSVPYEFFKNMPQHLADAPMVIDNGNKVSIITSYEMQDTKGNDSYVIAGVWKDQQMESDTVNLVKSVYPWDDFANRITKAAENGSLVIVNKNKVEQMFATIGVQPSEVSRIIDLARDSISQTAQDVNTNSENSRKNSLSPEGYADTTGRFLSKDIIAPMAAQENIAPIAPITGTAKAKPIENIAPLPETAQTSKQSTPTAENIGPIANNNAQQTSEEQPVAEILENEPAPALCRTFLYLKIKIPQNSINVKCFNAEYFKKVLIFDKKSVTMI